MLVWLLLWGGCAGEVLVAADGGGSDGGTGGQADAAGLVCEEPAADCNAAAEDGCEVDLASAPEHCGACGRSCMGGACEAGGCGATTAVAGAFGGGKRAWGNPAADGAYLYWLVNPADLDAHGMVMRAPLAGGAAEPLGSSATNSSAYVHVDDTHVYWVDMGTNGKDGILRMPKTGGEPEYLVAGPGIQPQSMTMSGNFIVWHDELNDRIVRMSKTGSGQTFIASGYSDELGMIADEQHVYWVQGDGVVRRVALTGGTVDTLTPEQSSANTLALGPEHVYFPEGGSGDASSIEVRRVPKSGGAVEAVATGQYVPRSIGISAAKDELFWASPKGVMSLRLDGGEVAKRADEDSFGVLVTPDALYWDSYKTDDILMVAR